MHFSQRQDQNQEIEEGVEENVLLHFELILSPEVYFFNEIETIKEGKTKFREI